MRIIFGKLIRNHLKAPKGYSALSTAGIVTEAVLSMSESLANAWSLLSIEYIGGTTLGSMGLNQEAECVDFVEQNPECSVIAKSSLRRTGGIGQACAHSQSASEVVSPLDKEYDVILLGIPPRSVTSLVDKTDQLYASEFADSYSNGTVQPSYRNTSPALFSKTHLVKNRRHGETCISVYQKGE